MVIRVIRVIRTDLGELHVHVDQHADGCGCVVCVLDSVHIHNTYVPVRLGSQEWLKEREIFPNVVASMQKGCVPPVSRRSMDSCQR